MSQSFIVTEKAMRPASPLRRCFYCLQDVGAEHKAECVLIKRKAKVRVTIEYEVSEPASWDGRMIEFHRNESSWCAGNLIDELDRLNEQNGCLCPVAVFEFIEHVGEPFMIGEG